LVRAYLTLPHINIVHVDKGAYKPFLGSTVGHFAIKIGDGKFLTSKRKTKINEDGLVCVETKDNDTVIAHGFRPSVGDQSQSEFQSTDSSKIQFCHFTDAIHNRCAFFPMMTWNV